MSYMHLCGHCVCGMFHKSVLGNDYMSDLLLCDRRVLGKQRRVSLSSGL